MAEIKRLSKHQAELTRNERPGLEGEIARFILELRSMPADQALKRHAARLNQSSGQP